MTNTTETKATKSKMAAHESRETEAARTGPAKACTRRILKLKEEDPSPIPNPEVISSNLIITSK